MTLIEHVRTIGALEPAVLDPYSDTFKLARTARVGEGNRAAHALDSVASVADELPRL